MGKEATRKIPELAPRGEESIILNKDYVVMSVEDFESEVQGFLGWRVVLDGGSEDILAIPLWVADVVSRSSKMGSFIEALGNDPDAWAGHIIQIVKWQPKDRAIKVVK